MKTDSLKFSIKNPLLSEKDLVSIKITSGSINFLKVNDIRFKN
jgi:hypothetical protein